MIFFPRLSRPTKPQTQFPFLDKHKTIVFSAWNWIKLNETINNEGVLLLFLLLLSLTSKSSQAS